ncbi:MAG: winged helix DNA-binding protein [Oscillospiraceae bacterium]
MHKNEPHALELFRAMTRTRKAWHKLTPTPEINKSLFITLMALAHARDEEFFSDNVVVSQGQGVILSDLAALMQQSLSSVSQRATALEEMGYLRRTQETEDRRAWRLELTPEGEALVKSARKGMEENMADIMERFGNENVDTLVAMLNKFSDALEESQSVKHQNKE